jgi:hypothetical protein
VDRRDIGGRIGLERRELALEDRAAAVVFIAQIDVDLVDTDRPGGDQRAFDEAVRVALEVVAVLERARLAFVDVDRAEARRGFGRDRFPFPAGGKPAPPRPRRPECPSP